MSYESTFTPAGAMAGRRLGGFTIYRNPSDRPGMYVLRGWGAVDGKVVPNEHSVEWPDTDEAGLAYVRNFLRGKGLTCLGRSKFDDPVILETWL